MYNLKGNLQTGSILSLWKMLLQCSACWCYLDMKKINIDMHTYLHVKVYTKVICIYKWKGSGDGEKTHTSFTLMYMLATLCSVLFFVPKYEATFLYNVITFEINVDISPHQPEVYHAMAFSAVFGLRTSWSADLQYVPNTVKMLFDIVPQPYMCCLKRESYTKHRRYTITMTSLWKR